MIAAGHLLRKRAETTVGDRTVCPVCHQRFASDTAVRDHTWDAHGACYLCGAEFDTPDALFTPQLAIHDDELSPLEALEGNLCRCIGYQNIVRAVENAPETLAAETSTAETLAAETSTAETLAAETSTAETTAAETSNRRTARG